MGGLPCLETLDPVGQGGFRQREPLGCVINGMTFRSDKFYCFFSEFFCVFSVRYFLHGTPLVMYSCSTLVWYPLFSTYLTHHRKYATRTEAEAEIREYIEIFYNRQRIQKRLGYCSPASFEKKYLTEMKKTERFGIHY